MLRSWSILLPFVAAVLSYSTVVALAGDLHQAAPLNDPPHVPRILAFSDSDFFDYLATSERIEAYRLEGLRAAGCDSSISRAGSLLDCFPLDGALAPPSPESFEQLVLLLDECTWIRAKAKTRMPGLPELGVRFMDDTTAIDLIVGFQAMKAAISMEDQGAMVASIPESRRVDLLRILRRIDPTNPSISKPMEAKYRHEGRAPPTVKSLATGCDCEVGDGEFVYYEEPPTPVSAPPPGYPDLARVAGVQGKVVLHVLVDTEGVPCDIKVQRSVAYLDQAAIDAVKQWRFKPGLLYGAPLCVWVEVPIDFHF